MHVCVSSKIAVRGLSVISSSSINQTGTATSSPDTTTPSPLKNVEIANVLWYMKKNGYADSPSKPQEKDSEA